MEFLVLSNFQIFLIILSIIVLIIFTLVNNRSKNIPTDTEAFNYALKALVDGDKDKAYNLLRDIISKDDWSVMTANVRDHYYDIYALRHKR